MFAQVFRHHGLPESIKSDNGTPFASIALGRLSRLSVWWIKLGIEPELIEPGKPQQNGSTSGCRVLKAETTRPPAEDLRAQQRRFDRFRREYNEVRPHEAIELEVPASRYCTSERRMPRRPAPLEYPAHYETRRVSADGGIRWRSQWVAVSHTCTGEQIGLEAVDDGIWDVYLGPVKLGRLLEETMPDRG